METLPCVAKIQLYFPPYKHDVDDGPDGAVRRSADEPNDADESDASFDARDESNDDAHGQGVID